MMYSNLCLNSRETVPLKGLHHENLPLCCLTLFVSCTTIRVGDIDVMKQQYRKARYAVVINGALHIKERNGMLRSMFGTLRHGMVFYGVCKVH